MIAHPDDRQGLVAIAQGNTASATAGVFAVVDLLKRLASPQIIADIHSRPIWHSLNLIVAR